MVIYTDAGLKSVPASESSFVAGPGFVPVAPRDFDPLVDSYEIAALPDGHWPIARVLEAHLGRQIASDIAAAAGGCWPLELKLAQYALDDIDIRLCAHNWYGWCSGEPMGVTP